MDTDWVIPLLINVAKVIAVLVIGYIIANRVSAYIKKKVLENEKLDDTLGVFFSSIVRWIILAVILVAVLGLFGIEATSLVAILGASSLAIGLALQGTLSNIAAGVMIIIFRPFKLGDFVDIGGTAGTVHFISIFVTELVTPDNVKITLPNGSAWGSVLKNFSAFPTRRLDLTFNIDYNDDPDKAIESILAVLKGDDRVHSEPEPWARVVNLGDSSVDIGVRVWCDSGDYWELKFAMTKAIFKRFNDDKISIPYPHQVLVNRK